MFDDKVEENKYSFSFNIPLLLVVLLGFDLSSSSNWFEVKNKSGSGIIYKITSRQVSSKFVVQLLLTDKTCCLFWPPANEIVNTVNGQLTFKLSPISMVIKYVLTACWLTKAITTKVTDQVIKLSKIWWKRNSLSVSDYQGFIQNK
jgi:hypothetical protein